MKKTIFCALILMMSQAHASGFADKNIHFPNFEKISPLAWGPIWLPGSSLTSGFRCYDGTYSIKPVTDQVAYRLQIENNPGDESYSVKIAGFHVIGMRVINNPVPSDLSSVAEPRTDICSGNIVNGQFQGHQISLEFVVMKAGQKGPNSLNDLLGESQADLQKLKNFYGPLLKSAQANASESIVHIPYAGSAAYTNVDTRDPLATVMSAMNYGKTLGSDKGEDLAVIQTVDSL